jgi:hypothetical protein
MEIMADPPRTNPYEPPRTPAGDERPGAEDSINELSYFPETERHSSSIAAIFAAGTPMLFGAAVGLISGSGRLALGAITLGGAWAIWKRRRIQIVPRAKLRIEGDTLHLSGAAFKVPISVPLRDLLDVYLDTKTIQRVQENPGPIPDLRFLNSTVSAEMDTARIALELERETFFLTEQRVSHTDANEGFSKIRRFLRRHGWVPEDERAL